MSLFLWSYVVGMFNGEVASSLRWEQVIRQHLSGPVVAEEALKLGCFRSLGDFDFWLRERHDVRGELMFGIRVGHHRVAQMGVSSRLGSRDFGWVRHSQFVRIDAHDV